MIKQECKSCNSGSSKLQEVLKKKFGCTEPAQKPVWYAESGEEFYNCPIQFVTDNVRQWYQEMIYDTNRGIIGKPYREESARYADAMQIYDQEYNMQLKVKERLNNG